MNGFNYTEMGNPYNEELKEYDRYGQMYIFN